MIVDYAIDELGSIIHVFMKGKHHTYRFKPYYYEPSRKYNGNEISITKRNIQKIEVLYPKDVPKKRSEKSLESDILFPHRFILDRIRTIDTDYSFLCFDIENSTKNMPKDRNEVTNGHSKVFSIAGSFECPWNSTKNYDFVLYLRPSDQPNLNFKYPKATMHFFDSEDDMLRFFIELILKYDPDILTGWYSDNYDLPYLISRMKKLGISPQFARDDSMVKAIPQFDDDGDIKGFYIKIWGRAILDALKMYRTKRPKQKRSWKLEYISKLEKLKTPKFKLPGVGSQKYEKAWRENAYLFTDYNFHDVLSAKELFKRDISHFKLVQSFAFCTIDKSIGQNSVTGSVLLRLAGQKTPRRVLPRGGKERARKIPGGKVFDTKPGYWEEVDILDFVSYYPNLIKTFNLSMETYLPKGGGLQMFNGYNFDQKERGLLAEAMDVILPERFRQKALMKSYPIGSYNYDYHNDTQSALKQLADGMYGATKNGYFRMHSIPVAETITMTGQQGTTFVEEFVIKDFKANVIGGDTDSIMEISTADADKVISSFDFEKYMPRLCWGDMPKENSIELHWDGQYPRFFQTAEKKHYFGLTEDDRFIQRGFYKADLPAFAEPFQELMFRGILDEKGVFPEEDYFAMKRGYMTEDMDNIAFISKFPGREEFKKAVTYSEEYLGINFLPFDRPMMFKLDGTGSYPYANWIAVTDVGDIPPSFTIDREAMWKRLVSQSLGETVTEMITESTKVW